MRFYAIYHPSEEVSKQLSRADETIFVKEGFSWDALFAQFFWLLYHRLWVASIVYMACLAVFIGVFRIIGISEWLALVLVIIALLFAFEANDIRGYFLGLKGYSFIGTSTGTSLNACEIKFFEKLDATLNRQKTLEPEAPQTRPQTQLSGFTPQKDNEGEAIIGLFPKPGV